MALNKKNVKSNAGEVAKTEAMKSEKMLVENILIENLIPDPNNGEDVSVTSDLEYSITQNGFNDPIVVTTFGMEEGKYRIVSGHRRTEAMKKLNKTAIPCFIRDFSSEKEVAEAREAFNLATRDSAKDPFLYERRWEKFLMEHTDEKIGKVKEKFAEISGLSNTAVNRLQTAIKLVQPIRSMVADEIVGKSSCEPIAPLEDNKQMEIYNIMVEANEDIDGVLTRPNVKTIVEEYKKGKTTWAEIKGVLFPMSKAENKEEFSHGEEREESHEDFDEMNPPVHEEDYENEDNYSEDGTADELDNSDSESLSETGVDEEEVAELRTGKKVMKLIDSLCSVLNKEFYDFGGEDETSKAIESMFNLANELVCRAEEKVGEINSEVVKNIYKKAYNEHKESVDSYKIK